jgi:hypothetical protein
MIELKDGTYYKAVWNFEFRAGTGIIPTEHDGNVLGALFTTDPERKLWTMTYRFRYYVDDINDNTSQDVKNWYRAENTGPEDKIWEDAKKAMTMLATVQLSTLNCVMIESDKSEDQLKKIQELPGMNVEQKLNSEQEEAKINVRPSSALN